MILTAWVVTALLLLAGSYPCLRWGLIRVGKSLRAHSKRTRRILLKGQESAVVVGFFHPYCNAGGGGERVLWAAVRATQAEFPTAVCVIYTGDTGVDKNAIVMRAKHAFDIVIEQEKLVVVHLSRRILVDQATWPRFTLIGQSLGSLPLAYEAISSLVPDIFIDTMGYAFTYPLVALLLRIPVATYTHYPTISTDMLSRVKQTNLPKLLYWRLFAYLYSLAGSFADVVMCNSTWTANHIRSLWHIADVAVVYPPCDTRQLSELDLTKSRAREIICVAQFRPEKNHAMLLQAFAKLRERSKRSDTRLVLIGTVRHEQDEAHIQKLKTLAFDDLALPADAVDFRTDLPWAQVVASLGSAWIGANAMRDEHFGIGVVEYMAAGLIACVHDSAGPKLDIVVPCNGERTGFHAVDVSTFADAFEQAFSLQEADVLAMRRRARLMSERFSEQVFEAQWRTNITHLMRSARKAKIERSS
ncbi:asparagine-linked glycosylation protein [Savitreella phatthalungensis]